MKAKTFAAQYELVEFNHYMDYELENSASVVDMVVESNNIDFIEEEFNSLFVVSIDSNYYVFSDYELIECYKIGGGLIRIICVK